MFKKTLLLAPALFLLASCDNSLLKTEKIGDCWKVDVTKLGEYTLLLGKIELRDSKENLMWSIEPRKETAVRVGGFTLCKGKNKVTAKSYLPSEDLVVYPQNSSEIYLKEGNYILTVTSPEHESSTSVKLDF